MSALTDVDDIDVAVIGYPAKDSRELSGLNAEAYKMDDISSNLKNLVSKGLALAENISKIWCSGDFENKQKLQYLVFPEGVYYNKEKDTLRTGKINSVFEATSILKRVSDEKEKGNSSENYLLSNSAGRTGFDNNL